MKIGINGFGRMGRLALRAGWDNPDVDFVLINEPNATAETLAILTEFDSTQGKWEHCVEPMPAGLSVGGDPVALTDFVEPKGIPWGDYGVDVVLECSGQFRETELIRPHLEGGAAKVVVSAPVEDGPPNIVIGVNHETVDFAAEAIVTAASCTTNCLAPVVRVIHDEIGIERGLITTMHNVTNTQSVHDAPHSDPRRARSSLVSLIPTSTNSASAVALIIPELAGKLDSVAVRVPVLNASLIDCVFDVARDTSVEEVNDVLKAASEAGPLKGILGFEERPLVSVDYAGDPRSSIVDALSTRVIDQRLVKVFAWYDNEWGYANRLVELALMFREQLVGP